MPAKKATPIKGVRRKCAHEPCSRWFTPHHPKQKYHERKCLVAAANKRYAETFTRVMGVSMVEYYRRQKLDRKRRTKQTGYGPIMVHRLHLPMLLVQQMEVYPGVNWSLVCADAIRRHIEHIKMR